MTTSTRPLDAVAVRMVNVDEPLADLADVADYATVRVYVVSEGRPIGCVDIPTHRRAVSAARLRDAVVANFAYSLLTSALARHYTPASNHEPGAGVGLAADVSASVVVATRDRPDDLRACLRCLAAQESPRRIEVVVVDNNPASGLTPPVVAEFPGVVLASEPRQGLSYARNRGIAASTGEIVVATDDDVTMPPDWIERLLAPFARAGVMGVTGNVLPLELETEAQRMFELYAGLGRGFGGWIADADWFRGFRTAVPTWNLGATANAAFRASVFSDPRIGALDEALGAGSPTGCSEDTYLFYRILKAGGAIVYEPAAYVWHRHRRSMSSLRHQIYSYSKGHVAYHLVTLLRDGDRRALVRLGLRLPATYVRRALARLLGRSAYPVSLILLEIAGNLAGPWALWRSRRRVARLGRGERPAPLAADPRSVWNRAISEEVAFWDEYIATGGMQWKDEFRDRLDPHLLLQDNVLLDRLSELPGESASILDVGAGPMTVLGKVYPGKTLRITAVDPLAEEYERLLAAAGLTPPVATLPCHGEELLAKFEPETFDLAHARNSLDHSYDPLAIIDNMIALVRAGGTVVLRHLRNEGEDARYEGLHQWNFDVRDDHFVIWNHAVERDVTRLLAGRARVDCYLEDGWVVCVVTKLAPPAAAGRDVPAETSIGE